MQARQPRLRRVDIEGVGHAPTLAEPIAVAALDAFYPAEATSPHSSCDPDDARQGAHRTR